MSVQIKNIPFHKAAIGEEEINEVVDTIKSGWLTMGPKTIEFEKQFADYFGVEYAISMNSATACLHLALKAIGLNEGDEVILPTTTFVSTAEVVTYFNAIPVLCDIREEDHNIDVSKIESLITNKTKAIIPVHFSGIPCDMDTIHEIAKKFDLKVIEDAAHALPSEYNGKKVGGLSDITCFSFYATKTLATGEGGMATTNNEEYALSMKRNRLHGISKDAWNRYSKRGSWFYEVVDNGYKYNMTDIAASFGLVQLKKLNDLNKKRTKIAKKYTSAFANHPKISILTPPKNTSSSWHLFVIKVEKRDEMMQRLKDAGIGSSLHFIPVHCHPYYQKQFRYDCTQFKTANKVFNQSISIPIFPDLSDSDVDFIIETILNNVDVL
ncbi:MAG: DegT/DnrJ/EryC1/StrS family aminotransferase [Candidatus Margulisiibacteriota bacterium]